MINQLIKLIIQTMIRMIVRVFSVLLLFAFLPQASAQDSAVITLEQCYLLARQQYPLTRQSELIEQTKSYTISNLAKGYLPQVNMNGQATYQSAVTSIPIRIPNVSVPSLSKDQYKLYGEVNQVVYDGGAITQQKKSQEVIAAISEQQLEVDLYKLRERINQLYFGILLLQEQHAQTVILIKDLEAARKKAESAYANGTILKSNVELLKAELLKTTQRKIELNSAIAAYKTMLGYFIGQPVQENTRLILPQPVQTVNQVNRPELVLFDRQEQIIGIQNNLLRVKNRPRLGLFVQGGYGRPALNFLSNSFEPYYIGGIRLNWNLAGFYSLSGERSLLEINRKNIAIQKSTFLFNTELSLKQQSAEIVKLTELLAADDEIIALRGSIKQAAAAQLENGVINSSDYLREVNAEDLAIQNKITHQVQLLLSQYTHQTTSGN